MNKYDVKTVNGVDFVYIGNDVNGNCKYAVITAISSKKRRWVNRLR